MKDINVVTMTGRLTAPMTIKYTPSGTPVGKFSLAVNRNKKQGDRWVDEASFFECALFGKQSESLHQYMTKGKQLALTGELKQERWTSDGQNYSRVVLIVSTLAFMGTKSKEQAPQQQKPKQTTPLANMGPENFDDDIPF